MCHIQGIEQPLIEFLTEKRQHVLCTLGGPYHQLVVLLFSQGPAPVFGNKSSISH
jgi:hypothetical protein